MFRSLFFFSHSNTKQQQQQNIQVILNQTQISEWGSVFTSFELIEFSQFWSWRTILWMIHFYRSIIVPTQCKLCSTWPVNHANIKWNRNMRLHWTKKKSMSLFSQYMHTFLLIYSYTHTKTLPATNINFNQGAMELLCECHAVINTSTLQ